MIATIQAGQLAATRLRQIARLAALQQAHPQEFNSFGTAMSRRAIFAMVLDCREAGVPLEVIARATAGAPPP